jgi:hypothetical protein
MKDIITVGLKTKRLVKDSNMKLFFSYITVIKLSVLTVFNSEQTNETDVKREKSEVFAGLTNT